MALCHHPSKRFVPQGNSHGLLRLLHRSVFRLCVQADALHEYVSSVPFWHADPLHRRVWPLHAGNGNGTVNAERLATPSEPPCESSVAHRR